MILLDAEGRPVFANRLAEQVLRAGRWLTVAGGRIAARHPADRAPLAASIAAAAGAPCRAGDGGIFAPRAAVLVQFDAPGRAGPSPPPAIWRRPMA